MDKVEILTTDNSKSEILIDYRLTQNLKNYFEDKKYFLITNTTLAKLYPEIINLFDLNKVIVIKDGEKYKNEKTYNYILNKLFSEKIERKDCIVALGGGVVGDLAGFCASSILRGVELIQIPTTLLAMCDSSIGGKTGYNTKYGKNLVGSFYMAKKVLIDPWFLGTLNEYQYRCGLGEVLKYAFIEKSCKMNKFYDLIDFLITHSTDEVKSDIQNIIRICVNLKASVVSKDKLEGGLRKILNFGHTYAHPIETLSNYKKISHGEAVCYGIKCASKLAFDTGKIDKDYFGEICYLIDKFKIIQNKINYKKEDIIELMKQDKKVKDAKINLLLPTAPAVVELFDNINLPLIEASVL